MKQINDHCQANEKTREMIQIISKKYVVQCCQLRRTTKLSDILTSNTSILKVGKIFFWNNVQDSYCRISSTIICTIYKNLRKDLRSLHGFVSV